MRKKAFYVIHLVTILLVISLKALGQVPEVKIVHFGVGNADCTLIVAKDYVKPVKPNQALKTITILIDTGSISATTGQNALTLWPRIWGRIQREGGDRLDYFVISHLHEDHVGNATGILQEIESKAYPWRRDMVIIDRYAFTSDVPVTYNGNTAIYRRWLTGKPGTKTPDEVISYDAYYKSHFNGFTYTMNVFGAQVTVTLPPQRRQIFFGQDLLRIGRDYELENIQMICVASDGVIGDTPIREHTPKRPRDENDLGFAFVLRFGSFRYFTGADLGYKEPPYTNVEDPLTVQLNADWRALHGAYPFHVCALKVNHHGSENSTGPDFVRTFNPQVAVFSSNLRRFGSSTKRHPTEEAIERLRDPNLLPAPVEEPIRLLLFTFRLFIPLPRDQGIIVDVDPMPNFRSYQFWSNGGPQDVTLYVKREDDGSPFVNDKPPKIYMHKQPYINSATPAGPEITYSPAHVTCKRLHNNEHKNLPLPSRTY